MRTRGLRAGLAATVTLCSEGGWTALRTLAAEGFEIVNHGWWHQDPTSEIAAQEVDESRKELQRRTGANITFYACPYSTPNPDIVRFALQHGHLGVRSGARIGAIVKPGEVDPADIPFDPFGSGSRHGPPETQLETFLDSAMDQRAWAVRGLRGVADTSWEPIAEGPYVRHLDRLTKLVKLGDLWVAPPSEVLQHALAYRTAGIPILNGSVLSFPRPEGSRMVRAQLSVNLRCEGIAPLRLVGEQHGVTVPSVQTKPGIWRLQLDPWEPAILDAHY